MILLNLGSGTNVFVLLAQREISPRAKHARKWHWGESSKSKSGSSNSKTVLDAKCGLLSWYLLNFSQFSVYFTLLNENQTLGFIFFLLECQFRVLTFLNVIVRVEAESLRNLSAKYCPLLPAPRSTIAAAFSLDGKMIASTQ
jgi:activator-of-BECN1-regulated-autophagy protein 1